MDRRDFNQLFTLRYSTAAGVVAKQAPAVDIHRIDGPRVNALGDLGEAWDIAVLDESGADVTGRFPCFT